MDIQAILNAVQQSGMLNNAAANAGASPAETQTVLQGALLHAQDGGGVEDMVNHVAQRCGIDPGVVDQVMPHILPMLESHFGGGQEAAPAAGPAGGLMGMLGGFLNRGA